MTTECRELDEPWPAASAAGELDYAPSQVREQAAGIEKQAHGLERKSHPAMSNGVPCTL